MVSSIASTPSLFAYAIQVLKPLECNIVGNPLFILEAKGNEISANTADIPKREEPFQFTTSSFQNDYRSYYEQGSTTSRPAQNITETRFKLQQINTAYAQQMQTLTGQGNTPILNPDPMVSNITKDSPVIDSNESKNTITFPLGATSNNITSHRTITAATNDSTTNVFGTPFKPIQLSETGDETFTAYDLKDMFNLLQKADIDKDGIVTRDELKNYKNFLLRQREDLNKMAVGKELMDVMVSQKLDIHKKAVAIAEINKQITQIDTLFTKDRKGIDLFDKLSQQVGESGGLGLRKTMNAINASI